MTKQAYICCVKSLMSILYSSGKTVFSNQEIRMLSQGIISSGALSSRLYRYVNTGDLLRLREGIYALPQYDVCEFAGKIQVPSYISMETILRKHGVIFQYDNAITLASYQTRTIYAPGVRVFIFRKLADPILIRNEGKIITKRCTYATLERAFLDLAYVDKWRTYENIDPIDKTKVAELLPIYNNQSLTKRVSDILSL